jgi:hypothetical protein
MSQDVKEAHMKISSLVTCAVITTALCLHANQTLAWHDATHMAVVKAAGLDNYAYLAVGPDMAKEKAGETESANHYRNNPKGAVVTPETVLAQVSRYNKPGDSDGHLYGAIVAAISDYILRGAGDKYALYPLGYASHYIGDLSMPLHNIAHDEFNRANHAANDGIVENTGPKDEGTEAKIARLAGEIRKRMDKLPSIRLRRDVGYFYRDLATQIAAIANRSIALGYGMEDAVTPRTRMTEEEAYTQLARSAQLLKAVYAAINDQRSGK